MNQSSLASRIKANLLADSDSQALDNPALEAMSQAVAKAVVDELTEDGVVTVTIGIADGGLQTSAAPGSPTAPPALPVSITGRIS